MATIYFLRHGQLPPNPEKRFIGQQDIPLHSVGIQQVRFWQTILADVPFTQAWTSDLQRCRQTVECVLRGRDVPVYVEPGLREINLGAWQDLTKDEVEQRFPGALTARGTDYAHYHPQGGESFTQVQKRAFSALHRILQQTHDTDTLLVVTHFGIISLVLLHYMALPIDMLFQYRPPYAACLRVQMCAEDFKLP